MCRTTDKLFLVVAAHGLAKLDVFNLPDPYAVIIIDSKQTHVTSVIKKTLTPYWNEHFDVSVVFVFRSALSLVLIFYNQHPVL